MIMLVLHIFIAIFSVGFATHLNFSPSETKLRVSYALVALTLLSGTYLVVSTGAQIVSACLMGLAYTLAMAVVIAVARLKLASQKAHNK